VFLLYTGSCGLIQSNSHIIAILKLTSDKKKEKGVLTGLSWQ